MCGFKRYLIMGSTVDDLVDWMIQWIGGERERERLRYFPISDLDNWPGK